MDTESTLAEQRGLGALGIDWCIMVCVGEEVGGSGWVQQLYYPPSLGGGVLHYMGYIGMCGPNGYVFSAVLVINRVSILAILPPFW